MKLRHPEGSNTYIGPADLGEVGVGRAIQIVWL